MKTLLLLRHAKSSWKDPDLEDHDRPLNKRGKREAPRMGELLKEEGLAPDFIVTSSAKRARRTAECAALHSGYRGDTRVTSELYEASAEQIRRLIGTTTDSVTKLLLVGHNPGLEELLEQLTGVYSPLSTAALAHLEVEIDVWREMERSVQARLIRIWQPRELP